MNKRLNRHPQNLTRKMKITIYLPASAFAVVAIAFCVGMHWVFSGPNNDSAQVLIPTIVGAIASGGLAAGVVRFGYLGNLEIPTNGHQAK